MEYSKAALSSGLIAFIVVISMSFISSGGRMYFSQTDWDKVNSMNYKEAQQYLMVHSKTITRWDSLKNGISHSAFWISALSDWVFYSLVGFLSCLFYRWLSQSNTSLKGDRAAL